MVLFRVTGGKLGRVFSLGLLLLVTTRISLISGQQGTPRLVFSMMHQYHRLQCASEGLIQTSFNNMLYDWKVVD
jgi:hypothetical protein